LEKISKKKKPPRGMALLDSLGPPWLNMAEKKKEKGWGLRATRKESWGTLQERAKMDQTYTRQVIEPHPPSHGVESLGTSTSY